MMSSQASNSESRGFALLDIRIQQWIWMEGWTSLRDAQERAIPALIDADQDVIIAAQTAAGKTEAAFLPILSHLLRDGNENQSVIYISPLKALINDQWDRLTNLCERLDISVTPWHGDITATKKNKFLKNPKGVLLITPESLEAIFVNRGSEIPGLFASLKYIVIDELHAFIGTERGKQLQSLMCRIELAIQKKVSRVGLSATLGDMNFAAVFLREKSTGNVSIIDSKSGNHEIQILVKGYVQGQQDAAINCTHEIAKDLYKKLHTSNNLIFPNSRTAVELYSDYLRQLCEDNSIPNVFWPHHGSLSKEIRQEAEHALKDKSRPANAICTSTLELGIDLGAVKSVAQIGSPPSVASLRQRLGRSGRRKGEPAILRGYCIEPEINAKSAISDKLHDGLIQTIAMVNLLLNNWFEPPPANGLHASTLVQQILSIIAEKGGVLAVDLWRILNLPFPAIEKIDFLELLKNLGEKKLIVQDSSGLLLHGELGEKLVSHYEFYCAFSSDDEMRIECNGKTLGVMAQLAPPLVGQGIIFAGKRWRVIAADQIARVVSVTPDKGGAPPAFSGGSGSMIHDQVRQEMYKILSDDQPVQYLDTVGEHLLKSARLFFNDLQLKSKKVIKTGSSLFLVTWCGDIVNNSLVLIFRKKGLDATNEGVGLNISNIDTESFFAIVADILLEHERETPDFFSDIKIPFSNKWDWALSKNLLAKSYCSSYLNVEAAISWLSQLTIDGAD